MIGFTYDDTSKTLHVAARQGEFPGMLEERVFNVIPVSENGIGKTHAVVYDGSPADVVLR